MKLRRRCWSATKKNSCCSMTPSQSARRTSIATAKTRTCVNSFWQSIRRSSGRCSRCCGRETMFRISRWIAVGLMLMPAAALANEDRYENSIHLNANWRGGRVATEHKFGHVDVRTNNGDEVTVRGTIRASDEDIGKQIHVSILNNSDGISIRTVYPEIHIHGGNVSYSADLAVTIPFGAPLLLRNRFGSIEVEGLRASSEIVNGQGSILFRDSRGTQRIENSFGSITIENAGGDTTVQNANGSIAILKVDVDLEHPQQSDRRLDEWTRRSDGHRRFGRHQRQLRADRSPQYCRCRANQQFERQRHGRRHSRQARSRYAIWFGEGRARSRLAGCRQLQRQRHCQRHRRLGTRTHQLRLGVPQRHRRSGRCRESERLDLGRQLEALMHSHRAPNDVRSDQSRTAHDRGVRPRGPPELRLGQPRRAAHNQ